MTPNIEMIRFLNSSIFHFGVIEILHTQPEFPCELLKIWLDPLLIWLALIKVIEASWEYMGSCQRNFSKIN